MCVVARYKQGDRVIAQALIGEPTRRSPQDAFTIADPTATFTTNLITIKAATISRLDLTLVAADGRRGDGIIAHFRRYGYYSHQQPADSCNKDGGRFFFDDVSFFCRSCGN